MGVAGQSRGIQGFGGSGAVSFDFLANGAMSYAPDDADRAALVAAIGRGVGRTAVHELTHQLLPTAPIHDSRDAQSYEFQSAARRAQYSRPDALGCGASAVASKADAPIIVVFKCRLNSNGLSG